MTVRSGNNDQNPLIYIAVGQICTFLGLFCGDKFLGIDCKLLWTWKCLSRNRQWVSRSSQSSALHGNTGLIRYSRVKTYSHNSNVQKWLFISLLLLVSLSVISYSLWPWELQHTGLPCPSLTPAACSNSYPLSQWCHSAIASSVATFFSLLPSIFPSIRVFSKELTLRSRWPEQWSFGFNTSPSNEYLELTSSRINCLDLFAVQLTLKNLLQHHNSILYSLHCLKTVTFAYFLSVQPNSKVIFLASFFESL